MTHAATLSTAKSFYRAYDLCRGDGPRDSDGGPDAVVPSIVCLAFAIELGLKALLVASGTPSHGHRLDELFLALPPQVQMRVIHESGVEAASFSENLKLVANAFVEWRYIYEHRGAKNISEFFLERLWRAVDLLASEKDESQSLQDTK